MRYFLDGIDLGKFDIPIDGIALTPDKKRVYYNALRGSRLYSVSTVALRDGPNAALDVIDHGGKPPSDGLAFSDNGKLYYGSLPDSS